MPVCQSLSQTVLKLLSLLLLIFPVTEEFDWLTSYTLTGKFPPSEQGYRCLPSFSSRLQITNDGHFVTNGLYLEDEQRYICSPLSFDGGSFVFQLLVRGMCYSGCVINLAAYY